MRSEPYWLPFEEIIELNRDLVADTHEPHSIIQPGELESGAHRPAWHWEYEEEDDVVVLAVRLLYGIARAHGFIQGNKRTGFHAALMFLRLNGYELDPATDSDDLGRLIVDVLNDDVKEDTFVDVFRSFVRPTDADLPG